MNAPHPHNTANRGTVRHYYAHPTLGKYWVIERYERSPHYMIGWAANKRWPQWKHHEATSASAALREISQRCSAKRNKGGYKQETDIPSWAVPYYPKADGTVIVEGETQRLAERNPNEINGVLKVYPTALLRRAAC